ncbi:MAG TPA: metallophosphoesterase [Terracidiphilus sp.]|nr:metallophosphoesterase [Terracidiphilus sp.]
MRIGIIGDTHLGCTDYSRKRRADFSTAFCNAIKICTDRNVDAICLLGDVFDSAATRRNVDAFAEILKEISPSLSSLKTAKLPLIAIPGNHEFGRGREAGELTILESLGFVQVLRCTAFQLGSVRICGIPWQHDPTEVPKIVDHFRKTICSGPQILLMHNFIKGARAIPPELGEIDPGCCTDFARTFVGHHHIYETVDRCVIPGSTETQNMRDQSKKYVVIYDCEKDYIEKCELPKTHHVVVLDYDITQLPVPELLSAIMRDLDSNDGLAGAFVYVRIHGIARAKHGLSKTDILSFLRERDLFDYYIDLRHSTEAKTATESRRGASIEQVLRRSFHGNDLAKARRYLAYSESERLFADIREDILSDHQRAKTR